MLAYRKDADSNMLDIIVDGKADKALFEAIARHIEVTMDPHQTIRLYEELRSVRASEPSLFMDDLKLSLRHLSGSSRCAIVADEAWFGWMVRTIQPNLACQLRYFPTERSDAARAWLRSEPTSVSGRRSGFKQANRRADVQPSRSYRHG